MEQPPVEISDFRKDHLLYILNLVSSIPATNKNLELTNDFVPLNAKLLQNKIRHYRQYLDYLIRIGVLITDNQYIKGQKSKGFRFSSRFNSLINIVDDGSRKRVKSSFYSLSSKQKCDYKHLLKWYNGLQIDEVVAKDFITQDRNRKQAGATIENKSTKELYGKDANLQYNHSFINIDKLSDGSCGVIVDDNIFRLHSCLTNLKSELRNLVTYEGLPLVSVDIKNSQPFLSTILLESSFWSADENRKLSITDIEIEYKRSLFKNRGFDSFFTLLEEAKSSSESDIYKYKKLVENGTFYDYLADHVLTACNSSKERKKVKAAVFQVIFTDNRFFGQEKAACKRVFKEHFPTVYKLFFLLKQKDSTNLPILLQRIESHLLLRVITKHIARKKPRLPIFTIHDSIITIEGIEQYVQAVMKEEFTRTIGIAPALSVEGWGIENLKFTDGSRYLDTVSLENALHHSSKLTLIEEGS